uniref:Uncharacterized protein n=1 Tax=Gossypium raimondii TaxID=29730 RepID=A0A0D2UNW1_GOSRA|nr:hypothetical protein B456_009G174900 [Gossypium raimondii]
MAEVEKQDKLAVNGGKREEEETLLEGMAVLDFDMLCSTVALQTQGKWRKLESAEDPLEQGNADFGGVLRMWEGEVVLDFLEDRRLALESACCPCYRFGKNMRRAGLGICLLQESRTLEMNNVQDGTWHGRGDICIGSYAEGTKPLFGLHPPPTMSIKTPEPCSMQNGLNGDDNGQT